MPLGEGEPGPPSLRDFSVEAEHLTEIRNLLGALLALQATPPGKRPKVPPPVRRPVTAAMRARKRAREQQHAALAAQLWPDQG